MCRASTIRTTGQQSSSSSRSHETRPAFRELSRMKSSVAIPLAGDGRKCLGSTATPSRGHSLALPILAPAPRSLIELPRRVGPLALRSVPRTGLPIRWAPFLVRLPAIVLDELDQCLRGVRKGVVALEMHPQRSRTATDGSGAGRVWLSGPAGGTLSGVEIGLSHAPAVAYRSGPNGRLFSHPLGVEVGNDVVRLGGPVSILSRWATTTRISFPVLHEESWEARLLTGPKW